MFALAGGAEDQAEGEEQGQQLDEEAVPFTEISTLELGEKAGVVGADAVDAELDQLAHPREVVDGPGDQLDPGELEIRARRAVISGW